MTDHFCDCERGGDCTRTTMCHIQTVVSDLEAAHEIETERLNTELADLQKNYTDAVDAWNREIDRNNELTN